jgi:hypothetical protein
MNTAQTRRRTAPLITLGILLLVAGAAIVWSQAQQRTEFPARQWIELPRDGYGHQRVVGLLEQNAINYQTEHHFGVTYVRVGRSDWPRVCDMLAKDSVRFKYPLNIKRKTMLGNTVDVVRN